MNEDKVLAFLNLEKNAERDKFMPKLQCGTNVFCTVLIGGGLLLQSFSQPNIAFAISFVIFDLIFGLILIINKNPALQIILDTFGILFVASKLFIGYVILSKDDFVNNGIPIFTWVHLIAFFLAFWLTIYMISWLCQMYKIAKNNSLSVAREKAANMARPKKWTYIVSALFGCPVVIGQWWYSRLENFGLGIGFLLWVLALIFTALTLASLPKSIVVLRFKVYKYFQTKKD